MNRPPLRGDTGSITTELAIVTPIAIALLCLVALVGRTTVARAHVDGAARDAARAASFARDPASAQRDAQTAATTSLTDAGLHCASTQISADVASFGPGGQVTVTVACNISLSDLGLIGLGGTHAITATAVEPIDLYRATT
jgi:Flp pilus assembly protein TadG